MYTVYKHIYLYNQNGENFLSKTGFLKSVYFTLNGDVVLERSLLFVKFID